MSASSTVRRNPYTGTNLVSTYDYTFKIFDDDDIQVIVRKISTGVETILTKTTDYAVTGVGNAGGGSISLVNASQAWLTSGYLLSTYKIVLRNNRVRAQDTDIKNNTRYYPNLHEKQFDKQFFLSLSQQDEIDRSIKISPSFATSEFDPVLPADFVGTPSAYLMTNAAGDGFETGASSVTRRNIIGTRAAPSEIVAATGIAFTGTYWDSVWFVSGSGGPVTVTAAARIAAGANAGQELTLIGRSDTNTVTLEDGNGIETGGQTITLIADSIVTFVWDSVNWVLKSTKGL